MFDRHEDLNQRERHDPYVLAGNISSYEKTAREISEKAKELEQDLERLIGQSDWSESDKDSAYGEIDGVWDVIDNILFYPTERLREMKEALDQ